PALLLSSCASANTNKPVQLHVRDFGAEPSADNIHSALNAAAEAVKAIDGPVEILFEPGAVYRISLPDDTELAGIESRFSDQYAWTIRNATNLSINGQGATLLITDPEIGGIAMVDSSHIELKNFFVDYDPLPHFESTITAVNLEEYWFELKIDDGFPEPDSPNFERAKAAYGNWGLTIRDEGNGRVRYGPAAIFADRWEDVSAKYITETQRLEEHQEHQENEAKQLGDLSALVFKNTLARVWRFYPSKDGSNFSGLNNPLRTSGLKVGDRYVHMARNWSQIFKAEDCDHVLWEGLTIYASPGLAYYPRGSSHHTIRDCHNAIKSGRIFSTTSDGVHARGTRGHLLIENCSFDGMADDGINVHSSALSVAEVLAPNQIAVKKHTFSVRPGDLLQQVRAATASIMEQATVQAVADQGGTWLVTLEKPLANVVAGDNFYNLSEAATPFTVRNCHFKNYRGRGVLISAVGGTIENCTFEMPEGWGIVLHYETTKWAEGPLAYDLKVLNNTFHGKGSPDHAAIRTEITTPGGAEVDGRPFHNIRIEGNRFHDYAQPVMDIHHARNITIRDNRVFCSSETPRKRAEYAAIELFDCENVTIEELAVEDAKAGAAVKIAADCAQDIKIDTETLKLDMAEGCKPILDQRKE
ncbi:MAG: right-handed parallel beta-helix repeat-containing protein, partial [Verrucomicrobiota bacterium]